jgi:hypothetical protein
VRPAIDPGRVEIFPSPPRHYEEIALLDASSAGGLGHFSRAGTDEAISNCTNRVHGIAILVRGRD